MRLSTKTITHYLLDRGFLSSTDLINGDYILNQSQSRNSIFLISLGGHTGLFVKQLIEMDTHNIYLMQKDATAHQLIHSSELFSSLKVHVPKYYGYDVNKHILVTENYINAPNLFEYYKHKNELSTADASVAADILSALHQDISEELTDNSALQFFNRNLPWVLRISANNFPNQPVIQRIQQDEFLCQNIYDLAQSWEGNSLIHGDIKLVNFLKVEDHEFSVKLIDWEIANIGDPLWDVAGFIQTYLATWVAYHPLYPQQVGTANTLWSLENCKQCMTTFWKKYAKNQAWDTETEYLKLITTSKYVAARLLQTAKESNYMSPQQAQTHSLRILQVAQNIFKAPIQAATDLMGIKVVG